MPLPRLRLAHQLSLLITAAVVFAVVVVGGLSFLNLRSGFKDYLKLRDEEQLTRLVALVERRSANDPALQWLRDEPDPMRVVMDDFNGRGARRPRPPPGPDGPPPGADGRPPPPPDGRPPRPPGGGRDGLGERLVIRDSQGAKLAGRPHPDHLPRTVRAIKVDGVEVGLIELIAEPELEDLDARFLQRQTSRLWWAGLAAIGMSVLAAWWLAGRWGRPLVALQRATRAIATGGAAPALVPSGATEIAQLVEDVNHMAAELARLEKGRRMWIAQISHELRTPLSVLRGEMEAIEDGARQATPDVMKRLQHEVLQLNRLVNDLHTVSVAELGALPCTFTRGDAHAWLCRMGLRFVEPATKQGLTLVWPDASAAPVEVEWDFGRIEQLLTNLITNSLRYTDAPGKVVVQWHTEGSELVLSVEDSAPGVSAPDLKELFEPLFRADRARQRSAEGGSGLGLAIVRSIALAHGGSVTAAHSQWGGVQMLIRLPLQGRRTQP